jgi:hypothetical protein
MALMEKIVSSVTKRGMITTQTLLNQGEAGSGQEPTNMQRRTLIGGALAALLSPSGPLMAQGNAVPRIHSSYC